MRKKSNITLKRVIKSQEKKATEEKRKRGKLPDDRKGQMIDEGAIDRREVRQVLG